jgi:hypothetical protein
MFIRIAAAFLATLFIGACAREKDPAYDPVSPSVQGDTTCLTDAASIADKYVHEKLSTAQIQDFWSCTARAVYNYQSLTRGDRADGNYSPQAIRGFIERYFLKSHPLNDALLSSLMELKRVLIAGTAQEVSVDDLTRLRNLLDVLSQITVDLQPHIGVLSMQRASATDQEIAQAKQALQKALTRLSDWLETNGQLYTYLQLQGLIANLQGWGFNDANDNLNRLLSILPPTKQILVSGDPQGFGGKDWRPTITALTHAYGFYLGTHYAFAQSLNVGLTRDALPDSLSEIAQILDAAVKARPDGQIPQNEWQDLFTKLAGTTWLPDDFTGPAMTQAWAWLLQRPLAVPGLATQNLTAAHIQILQKQIDIWTTLNGAADGQKPASTPETDLFWQQVQSSGPVEWDGEGRLYFPNPRPQQWTQASYRQMVWPFVILNWIKTAYVGAANELTPEQMNAAVGEILPLLQNFGWLKTTQPTIAGKLLTEADLFTMTSNGDNRLQLGEAMNYLHFVTSSLRTAQIWQKALQTAGCKDDVCARAIPMQSGEEAILSAYPRLRAEVAHERAGFFAKYLKKAEVTALGNTVSGEYGLGDMMQTLVVLHYVETFYQRYDADNSDSINLMEANVAYPVYEDPLTRIFTAKHLPTDQIYEFFTFMMEYGTLPFSMMGGDLAWQNWLWTEDHWAFEARRDMLLGILYNLSTN